MILVGYPLSVGPVLRLWDRGWLPDQVLYVYAPLNFLAENCPPVLSFFEWYTQKIWRWKPPPFK